MRAVVCYFLILFTYAHGRGLHQWVETDVEDILPVGVVSEARLNLPQDANTVFALGSGQTGGFQITGMLHNFVLDRDPVDRDPVNSLLDRPSTSYLDASWSNWVDQRLELLDAFQDLIAPPARPRCAHMQDTESMDNQMVSYLASSRFGPAIMTTYAQKVGDEQTDFDYDNVNIPASRPLQRSYEDASLQEEMSADADKAFEMAELESRMLSQASNVGYFGANMKNQMMVGQLDGDSESLQPMILTHPNLLALGAKDRTVELRPEASKQEEVGKPVDPKQLAIFVLLLVGCIYVWTSLIVSCIRLRKKARERQQRRDTDSYLIVPLAPEGADSLEKIQFASDYLPNGEFTKPLTA